MTCRPRAHGPTDRPPPQRPRQERRQSRALPAPLQDAHAGSGAARWSASASSPTSSRAAKCACRARTCPSPPFNFGRGGDREHVLPGNREYVDRRPHSAPRRRRRRRRRQLARAAKARRQDDFVFSLSREEFMQIFFDDLELPRLARTEFGPSNTFKSIRAGFAKTGVPANLAVVRTMTQALARRIALPAAHRARGARAAGRVCGRHGGRPRRARRDAPRRARPHRAARRTRSRSSTTPTCATATACWRPEPIARAVMFCLMDVSASMDEDKKDLAKRFFTLLYLFLTRKYEEVELVFIRHTDDAEEVDEDTFFHDPRSGGTVVYLGARARRQDPHASAMRAAGTSTRRRRPTATRSAPIRRAARASCASACCRPLRYYTYLELRRPTVATRPSTLWAEYERVARGDRARSRCGAHRERDQIYPVFRELFRKEAALHEQPPISHRRRLGLRPARALRRRDRARSRPSSGSTPIPTRSRSSRPSRCSTPTRRTDLPVGYPHWSYGKEFIRNEQAYRRGMQGLAYEIVINSDPCIAYLMEENTMTTQALVIAHASYGHNSFFKGNASVPAVDRRRRHHRLPGVRAPLRHGMRGAAWRRRGRGGARRMPRADGARRRPLPPAGAADAQGRNGAPGRARGASRAAVQRPVANASRLAPRRDAKRPRAFPPEPQENILYFVEKFSPKLEPWERELVRIVRKLCAVLLSAGPDQGDERGLGDVLALHDPQPAARAGPGRRRLHARVPEEPHQRRLPAAVRLEVLQRASIRMRSASRCSRTCGASARAPTAEDRAWFPELAGSDWRKTLDFAMRNFKDESFIAQYLSPRLIRELRLFAIADHRSGEHAQGRQHPRRAGYRRVRKLLAQQHAHEKRVPDVQIVSFDRDGDRSLTLRHTAAPRAPAQRRGGGGRGAPAPAVGLPGAAGDVGRRRAAPLVDAIAPDRRSSLCRSGFNPTRCPCRTEPAYVRRG